MVFVNLDPGAFKVKKTYQGQPSFDLKLKTAVVIKPYENRLISTGARVKIPKEDVGLVLAKNATNREGIIVFPTIYDHTYSGYIGIQCMNLTDETVSFKKGHTLAQLLLLKLSQEEECKEIPIKDYMKLFSNQLDSIDIRS